jgi:hypothetical protein
MKLLAIAIIVVAAARQGVQGEKALRGAPQDKRFLGNDDYQYAFLVSNVGYGKDNWCITADLGVHEGARLGFKYCDFHHPSARQLWRLDEYGQIHSKMNPDRCMIVDHGTHVVQGTRLRMADCDHDTTLGKFIHNGGTDFLRVKAESDFCVTNTGSNPNPTDFMVTQPCKNEADYKFTYKIYDPKYSSDDKHSSSSDDKHSKYSSGDKHSKFPSDEKHSSTSGNKHSKYSSGDKHSKYSSEDKHSKYSSEDKHSKYSSDDKHSKYSSDEKHSSTSDDKHSKHSSDDKHSKYSSDNKHSSASDGKHSKHSSDDKHSKYSSDDKHSHYSSDHHKYDYNVIKSASPAEFYPKYKQGCLVVKGNKASNDQNLLLGSCHNANGWRYDEDGLFHSELDDYKCMQADRQGPPKVGAMIRVYDCDKNNKLQRFEYREGVIRLEGENLCAAFRGIVGDVNQDPIILKPCNDETGIWAVYDYAL